MERMYTIHTKNGTKTLTAAEIIENAKEQERQGIKPSYFFYGKNTSDRITPSGWLIWSTYKDGCGVCYPTGNGKYGIVTGWQGEFCLD